MLKTIKLLATLTVMFIIQSYFNVLPEKLTKYSNYCKT